MGIGGRETERVRAGDRIVTEQAVGVGHASLKLRHPSLLMTIAPCHQQKSYKIMK